MNGNRWPTVQLGDACLRITDGTHQSPIFSSSGVPFLVISNVITGKIDWESVTKWVSQETYEEHTARCRPERGDVLYTAVGSFGVAVPVDTDRNFMFQRHIAHIKPDGIRLETRFLAHVLNSPPLRAVADGVAKGVAQRTVSLGDLKRFEIPLPPLLEQHRIADILDKADAIRRKRKQAIALTDQLLRSTFLEMFGDPVTNPKGWPEASVGSVADVQGGLQVTHARENNPISVPYLRVANVFRDKIDLTEIKQIRITESEMARAILQNGDVLVVEGHGNPDELGRAAVWCAQLDPCTHQNHLIRIRPKPSIIDSHYLCSYLNSNAGKQQMLRFGNTTSGLNSISTNNVRSVSIALPPTSLQKRFALFVNQLSKVLKRHRTAECKTQALFSSLVDRAFRGELSRTEQVMGQLSMFNK